MWSTIMSLDDWKFLFVSISIILVYAAFSPLIISNLRIESDPFFVLGLLGEDGMTEKYYPDDDSTIEMGEEIHWVQHIHNRMGETKYVAIRVKLLNSTMLSPNSTLCIPSSAPVVYEIRRVLLDNEIGEEHFDWSILDVIQNNDSILVNKINIKGQPHQTDVRAYKGHNFRIVFELWVYDEIHDDFLFGWITDDESSCVWNQIWFNVTITS